MVKIVVTGKKTVLPHRESGTLNEHALTGAVGYRFFVLIGEPYSQDKIQKVLDVAIRDKTREKAELQLSLAQFKKAYYLLRKNALVDVNLNYLGKGERTGLERWVRAEEAKYERIRKKY